MQSSFRLLLVILLAANALIAEISIQTRFSQPTVALGYPVQYIVEITASDSRQQPTLPAITSLPITDTAGLSLRNGRTSSSSNTQFINGQAEYRVTRSAILDVTPEKIGSYTIPAFNFEINGTSYVAPAATLTVVENASDAQPSLSELVFIKTDLPQSIYLGQTTHIQLKLFIADTLRSARITGYDLSANGFAMPTQLPNDKQESVEFINGRRFQVIHWPIKITPLRTGKQEVDIQFQLNARLATQGNSYRSQRSLFGGSIFDELMGRSQTLPVYYNASLDVLPLPLDGQPESYKGAIGNFAMDVSTDLKASEVGEPIMLSVKLTGEGNFDRIQAPVLTENGNWKHYSPETQQEVDPNTQRITSKRFDYVITPQRAGTLATPEVRFSFFDSETQRYTELQSESISVRVTPSTQRVPIADQVNQTRLEPDTVDAPAADLSRAITREEALTVLDYQLEMKRAPERGSPLTKPWFIVFNALFLALVLSAVFLLRRRATFRDDPAYAELRALRDAFKCSKAAADKADSPEKFYQHALDAVRLSISCKARRNLRNAELPELQNQLTALGLSLEIAIDLERLFESAYRARFSSTQNPLDLAAARTQLQQILNAL